jgi:transcriptional regulator with XRE-family HTH domain
MKKISTKKLNDLVLSKRKNLKLTQQELSEKTGINRLLIGKIEMGKFIPSINQLEELLSALDSDFNEIIEEEKEDDVFIALQGEVVSANEEKAIDEFISMMLCLSKHNMLRRKLNV